MNFCHYGSFIVDQKEEAEKLRADLYSESQKAKQYKHKSQRYKTTTVCLDSQGPSRSTNVLLTQCCFLWFSSLVQELRSSIEEYEKRIERDLRELTYVQNVTAELNGR